MKIRKSILLLTLMLVFSFLLVACGNSNNVAETDENARSVLVAYFSHTGNTKEAAQMIAEYTGGDLAEIKRAEEYGDLQEEAEVEILDGVHPEITVSVDSIDKYDAIFVGASDIIRTS